MLDSVALVTRAGPAPAKLGASKQGPSVLAVAFRDKGLAFKGWGFEYGSRFRRKLRVFRGLGFGLCSRFPREHRAP